MDNINDLIERFLKDGNDDDDSKLQALVDNSGEKIRNNIFKKLNEQPTNKYAQCYLGYMFHFGFGIECDTKEAVKYYKLSADQGYKDAQRIMGICY